MKKLIVFLLIGLTSFLTFKDFFSYAHFFLNRDYISQNFCINRESPTVLCSGKCYLDKTIAQNEDQEQNLPFSKKEIQNIQPFLTVSIVALPEAVEIPRTSKLIVGQAEIYAHLFAYSIFHPPQLV